MALARECEHVTELGVRYIVSTWAFVEGMEKGKLVSLDIKHPSHYGGDISKVEEACKEKGLDFQFIEASSLDAKLEKTDLLFIDTLHTGEHLKKELDLHASKAKKYIVFHDSVSCASEIMPVIEEFLKGGKWKLKEHYTNNNGLLVAEKC
jgi:hypothetical protein